MKFANRGNGAALAVALLVLFEGRASAEEPNGVAKTSCVSASGYKSVDDAKATVLAQAKREAVGELFGEFIRSMSHVEDFTLTRDEIEASSFGSIRIQGDPKYFSGTSLGEVCVSLTAYVTAGDLAKFKPQPLKKRACLSDPSLPSGLVPGKAEAEARVLALLEYDAGLKAVDPGSLGALVREVRYTEQGYLESTSTYCVTMAGVVYPIEVLALKAKAEMASGRESRDRPVSVAQGTVRLVTNSDFRGFLSAGGYREKNYWTADGWEWRDRGDFHSPAFVNSPALSQPSKPVVGVSWYEADAYCRWKKCVLPSIQDLLASCKDEGFKGAISAWIWAKDADKTYKDKYQVLKDCGHPPSYLPPDARREELGFAVMEP